MYYITTYKRILDLVFLIDVIKSEIKKCKKDKLSVEFDNATNTWHPEVLPFSSFIFTFYCNFQLSAILNMFCYF